MNLNSRIDRQVAADLREIRDLLREIRDMLPQLAGVQTEET